jgi:hypothetical protein
MVVNGPRGDDLLKGARERDKSWTDAYKQIFRELLDTQRQQ